MHVHAEFATRRAPGAGGCPPNHQVKTGVASGFTSASVLALQRGAGNAAVSALMRVQREGGGGEDDPEAARDQGPLREEFEVEGRTYVVSEGEGFTVESSLVDVADVVAQIPLPEVPATETTCDDFPEASFGGLTEVEQFAHQIADATESRESTVRARTRRDQAERQARRDASRARVRGESARDRRRRIQNAVDAVPAVDVAAVTAELSEARFGWLRQDFDNTIRAAKGRFGARCRFSEVVRGWLVARREMVDFETGMRSIRGLQGFGAPAASEDEASSFVALEPLGTGPAVQPITVEFLRALRGEHSSFRASNYRGHGGGSFKNRGLSLDLYLSSAAKDERGFWEPTAAVEFLFAVDRAATAVDAGWRVLYDDFRVARQVNRTLGLKRVSYMASSAGGRLNWHGPLVLHFHLDLVPPTPAEAP